MPKFKMSFLAYPIGESEPDLEKSESGIKSRKELIHKSKALVEKAIRQGAYEMILDVFEETEGAK